MHNERDMSKNEIRVSIVSVSSIPPAIGIISLSLFRCAESPKRGFAMF